MTFRVHELRVASRRDRAAYALQFDPRATVLRGENGTGKSSLLKTLYWCFGADPAVSSGTWKDLDICACVRFSVDNRTYSLVRHARQYGVFDQDDRLIRTFSVVTKGLGLYLAELFRFGLSLPNSRSGQPETPPPAFYLLPYYIDQDAGWKDAWSSFDSLSQYRNWKTDVAEYHTGLRPNEYYRLKAEIGRLKSEAEEPRQEERALQRAIEQVRAKMATSPVDFDLTRFQAEIDELVEKAKVLADEEERYRRKIGELSSRRIFLEQQVTLAARAGDTLHKQYSEAVKQPEDAECPTCGTPYQNLVLQRFRLALNEDRCAEFITSSRREVAETSDQISDLKARMQEASQRHARIWELLDTKRAAVTLAEVLQGEARGQAVDVLQSQARGIREALASLEERVDEASERLSALDSKDRKKAFLEDFRSAVARYSVALRVPAPDSIKSFAYRLNQTGSDLPRAVLAYMYGILHLAWRNSEASHAPLVIDSPNQQDQDPVNLARMLSFIRDNTPGDQQLILALVDPHGVSFGGSEVVLSRHRSVLQRELFAQVGADLEEKLSRIYESSTSGASQEA